MQLLHKDYLAPQSANAHRLYSSRSPELVASGTYQSSKTTHCLVKLHLLHLAKPGFQSLVVRKTKKALMRSVVPAFENKILPVHPSHADSLVSAYGKSQPYWYDYPNGGRMTLGGMNDADEVLSTEYDLIYYNQCEQATVDDWEKLKTRCNGRAGNWRTKSGRRLFQILGDCNPDSKFHFLLHRKNENLLEMLNFTLKDNILLYRDGEWTEYGIQTRDDLERSLSGMRYIRGFLGEWAVAEGAVYKEFDPDVHVIDTLPDMTGWQRFRSIDFGLIHPFICQWWAKRPEDGALFNYREYRKTNLTVAEHAEVIKRHSAGEHISWTVSDHDAEDNLTLQRNGIPTFNAKKGVIVGIEAVKKRLRENRIFFYSRASVGHDPELLREGGKPLTVLDEFAGYHHKPVEAHIGVAAKDDLPVKGNDDALDATQYQVTAHDNVYAVGFGGTVASRNVAA